MRFLPLLIALALCLCACAAGEKTPVSSRQPHARITHSRERAAGIEGDFSWRLVPGGVAVMRYLGEASRVEIPEKLAGKPVVQVGEEAFSAAWWKLESVSFPSGLEEIGDSAFLDCWRLTELRLPGGLRRVGAAAFANCGLESVSFPSSLERIDTGAFWNCAKLRNAAPPEGADIGDGAFWNCGIPGPENSVKAVPQPPRAFMRFGNWWGDLGRENPEPASGQRTYWIPAELDQLIPDELAYPRADWVRLVKEAFPTCELRSCISPYNFIQVPLREGAALSYQGGYYTDFDGDGRAEGIIVIGVQMDQIDNRERIVYGAPPIGSLEFLFYVSADGMVQPLTIGYNWQMKVISGPHKKYLDAYFFDGSMFGEEWSFQPQDGRAVSIQAPKRFSWLDTGVYGPFFFDRVPRADQCSLVFWDDEIGRYCGVGPVEMPVEDFLEMYNPDLLLLDAAHRAHSFFSTREPDAEFQDSVGDKRFTVERIEKVDVYAKKFYEIYLNQESTGLENPAGTVTLIRMRDGTWGVLNYGYPGSTSPGGLAGWDIMVYDVDFDAACRDAVLVSR